MRAWVGRDIFEDDSLISDGMSRQYRICYLVPGMTTVALKALFFFSWLFFCVPRGLFLVTLRSFVGYTFFPFCQHLCRSQSTDYY